MDEGYVASCTRVRIGDKWGLVHENGTEVIPVMYDTLEYDTFKTVMGYIIQRDRILVTLNGKKFYIDANGNRIE